MSDLRPLNAGEIIDGAIRSVATNARYVLGWAAVIFAPVAVLEWWELDGADLTSGGTFEGFMSLLYLGSGYEGPAFVAAVGVAVLILRPIVFNATDRFLYDRPLRPSRDLAKALVPMTAGAALYAFTVSVGLVFLLVPGVWLATAWLVSQPAIFSENRGPVAALARSMRLVQTRFMAVVGIGALLLAVRLLVSLLISLAAVSATAVELDTGAVRLLIVAVAYVSAVLIWPVMIAARAVIFADLRVRAEALDVRMLVDQLDAPQEVPAWDTTPVSRPDPTPTWAPPA